MEARIHMGANRTGVQMSPFDTAAMVQGEDDFGVAKSDDRADLRVRSDYADEAEGLGDAELLDNAGWEMLIALARNCGHDAMADGFVQAAREEAGHLTAVRAIVERLTAKEASIVGT